VSREGIFRTAITIADENMEGVCILREGRIFALFSGDVRCEGTYREDPSTHDLLVDLKIALRQLPETFRGLGPTAAQQHDVKVRLPIQPMSVGATIATEVGFSEGEISRQTTLVIERVW
jgi:hypothetical protein